MNRDWIELISSVVIMLLAALLLFGTAAGRSYRAKLQGGSTAPGGAAAVALFGFAGAFLITGAAHYMRYGWSSDPVRVAATLVLPVGVAVITYFLFRR